MKNNPLAPKATFTPEQHEMAKLRFVIDAIYERLFSLHYDLEHGHPVDVLAALGRVIKAGDTAHTAGDLIDRLADGFGWASLASEVEDGMHVGDCTAVPVTCSRCYAEQYYRVNTAPPSKAEGWRLLKEWEAIRERPVQGEAPTHE